MKTEAIPRRPWSCAISYGTWEEHEATMGRKGEDKEREGEDRSG